MKLFLCFLFIDLVEFFLPCCDSTAGFYVKLKGRIKGCDVNI